MKFQQICPLARTIRKSFLILWLAIILTACAPSFVSEQPQVEDLVSLNAGETIGQTFVARFDGLEAIEIYLEPQETGNGQLVLTVLEQPTEPSQKIAQSALPLNEITSAGSYSLAFKPQKNSTNAYYYLELAIEGEGSLLTGIRTGDTYYDHTLYQDRVPQDGRLAFRPHYDPVQLLFGLVGEGLNWTAILMMGLLLFVIPGWAVLSLTLKRWENLNWKVKLGLSAGASLGLYPVLILWSDLIGLHLGVWYAWLPALTGAVIILWRNRFILSRIRTVPSKNDSQTGERLQLMDTFSKSGAWLPEVLFLGLLLLIFATRFWHTRNLDAPMWGDSYQHTMMSQLFVDNAGLFNNWEPYVPYYSLTVHFGFPLAVALTSWMSGMPVLKTTLITGQILNMLAIITLVPLAARFSSKNRWSGVGVVLSAGLLSLMPAYYVNWGRYAQLAGLVILPVTLWSLWELAGSPEKTWARKNLFNPLISILLAGILIAGMVLSYYRMVFYLVFFIIAWLIIWGVIKWRLQFGLWVKAILILFGVAVVSFILILPWVLRVSGSHLAGAVSAGITIGSTVERVVADFQVWQELTTYIPAFLLFAATAALIWAFIRRQWIIFTLPLWVLLLTIYIGGQMINLPGANMMQSFAILISLYIPIGLMVGWLIDEGVLLIDKRKSIAGTLAITITLAGLGLWGALNLRSIAHPETYALVRRPDLQAMSWIQENILSEARILVEGFTINNARTAVGSDAGWWISLLALRENSMPPQYALMNEIPSPPDYSEQVVNLTASLEITGLDTGEGLNILCDHNISHIFIGQALGRIGSEAQQLFSPQTLVDSPNFELIYQQDRVYIFSVLPGVCEPGL